MDKHNTIYVKSTGSIRSWDNLKWGDYSIKYLLASEAQAEIDVYRKMLQESKLAIKHGDCSMSSRQMICCDEIDELLAKNKGKGE